MPKYEMTVEWVERTVHRVGIEAESLEEAEERAGEMWSDGSWHELAVEDEDAYDNGESMYDVGEAR